MVSEDWAWTGATQRLNTAPAMALEVVFLHILEVLEPFEKSPARHGFARATPSRAPTVSQRDDRLIGP